MARYAIVKTGERQQKHRKRARRLVLILVAIVIAAIALALYFYRRSMNPVILDIAQTRLKAETTLAVNDALLVTLSDCGDYSQFVVVEKNSQNEIVLLSANTRLVNELARSTAIATQRRIAELGSFNIDIPIGTLSGIPLLSELGQNVTVRVSPIGNVNCTFTSSFESAGINQTLHRIYINVVSNVDLIMPTCHAEVQTEIPVLLCESVIVGKVPDAFLQGGLVLGNS